MFTVYSIKAVKKSEVGEASSTHGGRKGACRILVWKPGGNREFGRPRFRCVNNIKINLQEVGLEVWTRLV
jgi:hypothetical protein